VIGAAKAAAAAFIAAAWRVPCGEFGGSRFLFHGGVNTRATPSALALDFGIVIAKNETTNSSNIDFQCRL